MSLPALMSVVDLLAQLPAVFLGKDSLNACNQSVIRRIELAFHINEKLFTGTAQPIHKNVPILGVAHQPILTFNHDHIEFIGEQIPKEPVVL